MMHHDSLSDGWIIASVLLAVWFLLLLSGGQRLVQAPQAAVGLVLTILLIIVAKRSSGTPMMLWDGKRGVLALVRTWKLEVCGARLMTSVPLGIDLSHAASRVLQAMHSRLSESRKGSVRFLLYRPLGQGPTRVGMMIVRTSFRLGDAFARARKLSEEVARDVMILEKAMRAAYPHILIENAGLSVIMRAVEGGIEQDGQSSK